MTSLKSTHFTSTLCEGAFSFTLRLPYPGKKTRYQLNQRFDGLQSRYGRFEEEKDIFMKRFEPWLVQLVAPVTTPPTQCQPFTASASILYCITVIRSEILN